MNNDFTLKPHPTHLCSLAAIALSLSEVLNKKNKEQLESGSGSGSASGSRLLFKTLMGLIMGQVYEFLILNLLSPVLF